MLQFRQFLSLRSAISPLQINLEKSISTTATNRLREILEIKKEKKLIFEGRLKETDPDLPVLKSSAESKGPCSVCSTNLDIKHTDVLILSQFLRSDGCMLPRRVTGLCKTQQKRISYLVAMAQKAGLMSSLTPWFSKKDPSKRREHKKCKTYFDESTIPLPKEYRKREPKLFRLI